MVSASLRHSEGWKFEFSFENHRHMQQFYLVFHHLGKCSLVVRALAAMLETLVRIQYIALLHASCLLERGEDGKHTCLIHMHSTVRFCPLQPFTTQTAKLIFISTNSGTHDKCRVFSTRDEEWRSHFVYTEGFTTQVRVLPRRPFKHTIHWGNRTVASSHACHACYTSSILVYPANVGPF